MPYTLSTIERDGYLHFVVVGENSPETVTRYLHETLSICRERAVRISLVEDALIGPDLDLNTLFEVIGGTSDAARDILDLGCYVKTTPGHNSEIVRYAENIAANHSLNVHVFRTVNEAERFIAYHLRTSPS